MSKEERNTYKIESDENLGEVQIADEVVAIIAGLAAMEVEGVSSMAGNATRELIAKLGMKRPQERGPTLQASSSKSCNACRLHCP